MWCCLLIRWKEEAIRGVKTGRGLQGQLVLTAGITEKKEF